MAKIWIIVLIVAVSFLAKAEDKLTIEFALGQYFKGQHYDYKAYLSDLNGDGIDDALVYMADRHWCGSGGCALFVFKGSEKGFDFLSKTMVSMQPIRISSSMSNGWRNLIVNAKGIGSVVLKYNGKEYTYNPTLLPKSNEAELNSAKPVIENSQ